MRLTKEQQEVVASNVNTLLVSASAGTGKTQTLVAYAKARPAERMIYLAFNRAIKDEAAQKFPKNVSCKTIHGLAYASCGAKYNHKLEALKAHHLQALDLSLREGGNVVEIINNFLASADSLLGPQHARHLPGNDGEKSKLIEKSQEAWALMCDTTDTRIPQTHDGYLKLFQIAGQRIPTDTILLDEAQDCTPCTLAIVQTQPAKKIFVGDARQSIYGFRGAVDSMERVRADQHLHLTGSFRFGEGIAALANAVLGAYSPLPKRIRGLGQQKTQFHVDESRAHTRLCRTNGILFSEAVNLLQKKRRFGFVGGVANYRFDDIQDAWHLREGTRNKIKDKMILSFLDFDEMTAYAETLDDKELKSLCRIVDAYGAQIPKLIADLREKASPETDPEAVLVTTAHRSKGREWPFVVLTDDFTDMEKKREDDGNLTPPDAEEVNLLYVAITRAQIGIKLPEALASWFVGQGVKLIGSAYEFVSVDTPIDSPPPPPPPVALPQPSVAALRNRDWLASLAQRLDSDAALPPEMRRQAAQYLRTLHAELTNSPHA